MGAYKASAGVSVHDCLGCRLWNPGFARSQGRSNGLVWRPMQHASCRSHAKLNAAVPGVNAAWLCLAGPYIWQSFAKAARLTRMAMCLWTSF